MNIDKVVFEKIKQKLEETGQSEDLIQNILKMLNSKDSKSLTLEEKNEMIEKTLEKIKIKL